MTTGSNLKFSRLKNKNKEMKKRGSSSLMDNEIDDADKPILLCSLSLSLSPLQQNSTSEFDFSELPTGSSYQYIGLGNSFWCTFEEEFKAC
ncbi:hypothetical protein LWI28_024250 [Acer negundo]|uniref:Uncharacterized protein n=1 Tax=Acer negundo TaxID=4023 RepID=A0AAD5P318_ACENE|nr:hypothetical protein LWI28_024250 [Acer negundo]